MHKRQRTFWAWERSDWLEILCPSTNDFKVRHPHQNSLSRQLLFAGGYLLRLFDDFRNLGAIDRPALASRIFGRERVENAVLEVVAQIRSWGYAVTAAKEAQWTLCTLLLANGSPNLSDLSVDLLQHEKSITTSRNRRPGILVLSKALAALGYIPDDLSASWRDGNGWNAGSAKKGVASEWIAWVDRWKATTTLQEHSRLRYYVILLKAGRWATSRHPACANPKNWTREIAAEWVATVCRMQIGDWTQRTDGAVKRAGQPLSAKARAHHLSSVSAFFRDCQEWEWIPRRFDPRRSFGAPSSLRALIGPKPRVIADDVWAKLLWAGINLTEADFGSAPHVNEYYYPLAMIKALAVVWLFAGLRIDEIRRLRVGCICPPAASAVADRGAHLPTGRASQQDQHRVSEARRCSRWRGGRNLGTCSPASTARGRSKDGRIGSLPVCLPGIPDLERLHKRRPHPAALFQSRCSDRGRSWPDYQPSCPLDDRLATLQRKGAHDADGTAALARP